MVKVRVKVRFRVRVSSFVTSTPHPYVIQSQPRPRLISVDWFQEPRPHLFMVRVRVICHMTSRQRPTHTSPTTYATPTHEATPTLGLGLVF